MIDLKRKNQDRVERPLTESVWSMPQFFPRQIDRTAAQVCELQDVSWVFGTRFTHTGHFLYVMKALARFHPEESPANSLVEIPAICEIALTFGLH